MIVIPSPSESISPRNRLLDPEDEGNTILRNDRNYLPNDRAYTQEDLNL
jgi:hypothetical protein